MSKFSQFHPRLLPLIYLVGLSLVTVLLVSSIASQNVTQNITFAHQN